MPPVAPESAASAPIPEPAEPAVQPEPAPAITTPNEGRPATPELSMHVSVQRGRGIHITELARIALACSILLLLLTSGAWLVRRALA